METVQGSKTPQEVVRGHRGTQGVAAGLGEPQEPWGPHGAAWGSVDLGGP
jgi:hypothetical protein